MLDALDHHGVAPRLGMRGQLFGLLWARYQSGRAVRRADDRGIGCRGIGYCGYSSVGSLRGFQEHLGSGLEGSQLQTQEPEVT